ncbi:MAG TPA: class I SAM-dependent methyltransferase [Mycobacteriales bacterium]|nr:class I SAM-dependent methyltransferase [Mycobacteriales bacterium]
MVLVGEGEGIVGGKDRRAWEDWARVDPLWSVLTEPSLRFGGWDPEVFFTTGREAIDELWARAAGHGLPQRRESGLDFGCGVGRLTRALARYVRVVVGLDIAAPMIEQARRWNQDVAGCEFAVHTGTDLRGFDTASMDVVCSLFVLQHLASVPAIETYLREFLRVLRPGGVVMLQLPCYVPPPAPRVTPRERLALRHRGTASLRRLGIPAGFLYRRLGWTPPMPMTALPDDRVTAVAAAAGGRTVWTSEVVTDHGGVRSRYYLISR